MTRWMVVPAFAIATLLASFSTRLSMRTSACLEGHPSVQKEYLNSWAVFVGRVISVHNTPETPPDWLDGTTYGVQVTTIFRGNLPKTIDIFSENSSGRFVMDSDAEYLLFAYRALGRTAIDNCGNSRLLSHADAVLDTLHHLQAANR